MRFASQVTQRAARVRDGFRTRLWPVPMLGVVLAVAAGIGSTQLDAKLNASLPESLSHLLFDGGSTTAREVLGAVSQSLITVTSLTFSLTLVTLQLASSQFSPRLLRTFARDPFIQRTLALFLATFVYALTVLRTVRSGSGDFVPELSMTCTFLLTLASVVALVLFLAHLVSEIRVESMLQKVHDEAARTADATLSVYDPDEPAARMPSPPPNASAIMASASGFLVQVDEESVLAAALNANAIVHIQREPGSWLTEGTPIGFAWPIAAGASFEERPWATLRNRVASAVHTGKERTQIQDIGFGLRQLTDVAVKSLSPGINDPTTAVHALGYSSSLLCKLVGRDVGPEVLRDRDGEVRVVLERQNLPALLDMVLSQPRLYGAADATVLARLFDLLREVAWTATQPAYIDAISAQLERLAHTVSQQDFDTTECETLSRLGNLVADGLRGDWKPLLPADGQRLPR